MNATGITLSFQDLALIIAGLSAVVGMVIWWVREEARKDYEHKCERERNDDQDVLIARQDTRIERQDGLLAKHDKEMQEFRVTVMHNQELIGAITKEVSISTKQIAKLMQGMHNWWRDDHGGKDH